MANLTDNGRNESLVIANQTSSPVIIASAFDDSNSGKMGYAQQLSAFPDDRNPVSITTNGTGTITLNKTSNNQPLLLYDLIAMRPQDLFPISDRSALPIDCKTHPAPKCDGGYDFYYTDITISQDEVDAMQQSYEFNKGILSYPDSDLAKTFANILSEYQSDPEKLEQQINSFFQNQTKNYTKCTLDSFVAASTYSQQFAFAWANLQSSYTYYVFQVAQNQQPSASGMSSIATIVFTKTSNAPNPCDVSDRNGGFEITYEPKNGETRKLSLVNGSLITASNPDFPDVALLVSFTIKSMFTGNVNDTEILPVLAGKIDGFTVIAVGQDSKAPPDSWYEFFHPQTAQQWAGLIGSIIGLAFAIYFLAEKGYALVKWYRQKRDRGEIPTRDEIKNKFGEISEKLKSCWKPRADELRLLDPAAEISEDYGSFSKVVNNTKNIRLKVSCDMQKAALNDVATKYRESLDSLLKYGNSHEMQQAVSDLFKANNSIREIKTFDDLKQMRLDITTHLKSVDTAVASLTKKFSDEMTKETIKAIENRQGEIVETMKVIEDLNDCAIREEEGEIFLDE